MAVYLHGSKSTRTMKRLLDGEDVEVLSKEDGLDGSWHSGIILACGHNNRLVKYTHLLSDDGNSELIETIPVCLGIEGQSEASGKLKRYYRGHIRPPPPHVVFTKSELFYGLCVDALVDDAWWEGVVFDKEYSSDQRLIFFPDQGDQQIMNVKNLRITLVWNEFYGYWSKRGEWMMLKDIRNFEKEEELPVSVREIWFDIRTTAVFTETIGDWTLGLKSAWRWLVHKVIKELNLVLKGSVVSNKLVDSQGEDFNDSMCMALTTADDCLLVKKEKKLFKKTRASNKLNGFPTKKALSEVKIRSLRGTKWESVNIRGAYDPEAIQIYASKDEVKDPRILIRAKKHLIAMGWKIEKNIKPKLRTRFIPPEGKMYCSLYSACCAFLQAEGKNRNNRMRMQSDADELVPAKSHHNRKGKHKKSDIDELVPAKSHRNRKREHINSVIDGLVPTNSHHDRKKKHSSDTDELVPAKSHRNRKRKNMSSDIDESVPEKLHHNGNKTIKRRKHERKKLKPLSSIINNDINEELLSNGSQVVSSSVDNNLDSGKFSNAVLEYKTCMDKIRNKEKRDKLNSSERMRVNAKKQLKRVGYKFIISGKQKIKSILSPRGKCIRSLYKACCEYIRENTKDIIFKKRNKKCKKKKSDSHSTPSSTRRSTGNILQTSAQQCGKTVLSLLIDNDMILPRQKVQCVREIDKHVLVEGQITRDGIKCKCCNTVHPLKDFEAHAGSMYTLNSANIILQDGRSLLECQMQMIKSKKPIDTIRCRLKPDCSQYNSDIVCSACHEGGTLLLCDHCPSSFHIACVGLETVPDGKWFCPCCRCGICGKSEFNCDTEKFTEESILYCDQCEREYHVGCIRKGGNASLSSCPVGNWFCNEKCSQIFVQLRQLIGKSHPTPREGLTWTLLRSSRENGVDELHFDVATMASHDIKLCVALDVLHECFVNIVEPRTKSDFVADLIFNRESELRRLNFYGFYTMLLEKGDELISVATFRVYGDKVAELPLIGTRVKYRKQGMCRLLVNELEKVLSQLGVETLVLPAVPQLLKTWTSSFGFKQMDSAERIQNLPYTTLIFLETTMCQKPTRSPPENPSVKEDCTRVEESAAHTNGFSAALKCIDKNKSGDSFSTISLKSCRSLTVNSLKEKNVCDQENTFEVL